MKFDLTEEQRLLADSVRRLLAQEYGFEARKRILASPAGWSEAAWGRFAELGLLAIAVPAAHGGFGGGAGDLAPVMEAFGEALVVEPFLATVVAARLVAHAGNEAQRAAILPAVAEGRMKLAFACLEEGARYDHAQVATRARREGGGFVLEGAKRVVLHAPMADRLVVSARLDGDSALFLVEAAGAGASLRMAPYRTLDNLRAADVAFRAHHVPAEAHLAAGDALAAIEEAMDFGAALACAEAVGAMADANAATLDYLKTRRQFGVPIGSFQALQHRMVEMVICLEQARSMAAFACAQVDHAADGRERQRAVSAARIKVADAARHVSQESVQLHGGMGMTEELKVSHTFRRLTMLAQQFGDVDHHLERFAALSLEAGRRGEARA